MVLGSSPLHVNSLWETGYELHSSSLHFFKWFHHGKGCRTNNLERDPKFATFLTNFFFYRVFKHGFTCQIGNIFAHSNACEQSNKRFGVRLKKGKRDWGKMRAYVTHSSVWDWRYAKTIPTGLQSKMGTVLIILESNVLRRHCPYDSFPYTKDIGWNFPRKHVCHSIWPRSRLLKGFFVQK